MNAFKKNIIPLIKRYVTKVIEAKNKNLISVAKDRTFAIWKYKRE